MPILIKPPSTRIARSDSKECGSPLLARRAGNSIWPWAVFLLLGGYLVFAHGCHGDEDTELFTSALPQASRER